MYEMSSLTNNVKKYRKAKYPRFAPYNERMQSYLDLGWPIALVRKPKQWQRLDFGI